LPAAKKPGYPLQSFGLRQKDFRFYPWRALSLQGALQPFAIIPSASPEATQL
jgi:hypothetical protein